MKKLCLLLLLTLSCAVMAQKKMYTPKELKEDADYYFSTLDWRHPDPNFFYSAKNFEKLKNDIYGKLNKPLSKVEFALIIGQINSYLDTHSVIPIQDVIAESFPEIIMDKVKKNILFQLDIPEGKDGDLSFWEDSADRDSFRNLTPELLDEFLRRKSIDKDKLEKALRIMPPVEVRENNLFLSGDSVNNIIEINGISAESIVSEHKKYFNEKLNPKTNLVNINAFINGMLISKIDPPFRIKFGKTDKEEVLEGMRIDKWISKTLGLVEAFVYTAPFTYEVYPSSSVAIFHMHTFEGESQANFSKQLEKFKKEVNSQNIKYVFYDLTINGGGDFPGFEALDVIKHDSVYLRYTETERNNDGELERREISDVVLFPNRDDDSIPHNRHLFVLQSAHTASRADYFCRVVADNKLGILVGEPTGELSKTFSYSNGYTMPHTNISFSMASILVDYSDFFKSLTTQPDINWDLKNTGEFTEQELLTIISYHKNEKTYVNK